MKKVFFLFFLFFFLSAGAVENNGFSAFTPAFAQKSVKPASSSNAKTPSKNKKGKAEKQSSAPTKKDISTLEQRAKKETVAYDSMRKKASEVASEVLKVKKQMIVTAKTIQEQEEALSRLEKNLLSLQKSQQEVKDSLQSRDGQLVTISLALQRLALRPIESLIAQPMPPIDTIRSAILLRETVKPLESSAEKLRNNLNILSSLKAAISAQAAQIKIATGRLEEKHTQMTQLLSQKSVLQNRFELESREAKKRADDLAAQARNLQELFNKLETEKKKRIDAERRQKMALASLTSIMKHKVEMPSSVQEQPASAFEAQKGKLPLPVRGKVLDTFHLKNASKTFSKGMIIQSRLGAQVVTPYDGTVLFSGPFKSYGNLLIIEHAQGYHSLLAGLERIDAVTGQNLLAGEPVGIMSTKEASSLYIEIRKNNLPVDPLVWFEKK